MRMVFVRLFLMLDLDLCLADGETRHLQLRRLHLAGQGDDFADTNSMLFGAFGCEVGEH